MRRAWPPRSFGALALVAMTLVVGLPAVAAPPAADALHASPARLVFRSPLMYSVVPLAAGAAMECVIDALDCPAGLECWAELTTLSSSSGYATSPPLPAGIVSMAGVEDGTIFVQAQLVTRPAAGTITSHHVTPGAWLRHESYARVLFDVVPTRIQRFRMPNPEMSRALRLPPPDAASRLRVVSVCFVGSTALDGIKVLFVQQAAYVRARGGSARYIAFNAGVGSGPVVAALERAGVPLSLVDLSVPRRDVDIEVVNFERSIADAIVAANYTVAAMTRAWQRSVAERVARAFEGCGVVVLSNGKNVRTWCRTLSRARSSHTGVNGAGWRRHCRRRGARGERSVGDSGAWKLWRHNAGCVGYVSALALCC